MYQIYLKLLNRLYFNSKQTKESNQGFVLPTLIGLGLIMTLVGLTLIGRSSTDQQTATSQKQATQAQAVAETGVTEVMQFLNQVRALADNDISNSVTYNGNNNDTDDDEFDKDSDWQDEYETVVEGVASQCDDVDDYTNSLAKDYVDSAENDDSWITINNGQDRFRVLNYNYIANNPSAINSNGRGILTIEGQANFNQNTSTSVVEVEIPVTAQAGNIPGLLVNQANLSNNEVDGDVLLKNCNTDGIDETKVTGTAKANPFVEYPELPQPPTSVTAYNLGSITSSKTLPDDHEVSSAKDSEGRYHYIVDSINLNGSSRTLTIPDGKKVTLYLRGDANFGGNAQIDHDCSDNSSSCKPTDFQVFGGDGNTDGVYDNQTTESFCLSGNARVDIFLFAPKAEVGVNGGGSNYGFYGTVWADLWQAGGGGSCSSNSGKTLVTQAADWTALPIAQPRTIASPTSWQRRSVKN